MQCSAEPPDDDGVCGARLREVSILVGANASPARRHDEQHELEPKPVGSSRQRARGLRLAHPAKIPIVEKKKRVTPCVMLGVLNLRLPAKLFVPTGARAEITPTSGIGALSFGLTPWLDVVG